MPQASHKRDPVAPTPPPIDVPVLMLQARTALRQTVHVALRSVDQIGRSAGGKYQNASAWFPELENRPGRRPRPASRYTEPLAAAGAQMQPPPSRILIVSNEIRGLGHVSIALKLSA